MPDFCAAFCRAPGYRSAKVIVTLAAKMHRLSPIIQKRHASAFLKSSDFPDLNGNRGRHCAENVEFSWGNGEQDFIVVAPCHDLSGNGRLGAN